MEVIINAGHTTSGIGTGAVGVVKETDKNREVEARLCAMLREKGHVVRNATVNYSSNDLADIVYIANQYPSADIFVSLHLNAFNGHAYGVETYIYSGAWSGKEHNRALAQKVQTCLVNQTEWADRKVKEGNLAVLRNTTMPAILVELGFCDNAGDMAKWNTETICRALFEGITGSAYAPAQPAGWVQDGTGWWYREADGSFPKSEWKLINNLWYYFKNNGYAMCSEISFINGSYYAFNKDCAMLMGPIQTTDSGAIIL